MQRIDTRTVVLTATEEFVKERFDMYLDRGHGIPRSAKYALNTSLALLHLPGPLSFDSTFVAWLSEGTVERHGTRFRIIPRVAAALSDAPRGRWTS